MLVRFPSYQVDVISAMNLRLIIKLFAFVHEDGELAVEKE